MSATVRMAAPMRGTLAELDRRQPVLARLGWASLALLGLCLAAMVADGRVLDGGSVWAKPAKFAASFVVWYWTLAWAWGLLAPAAATGRVARVVLWATIAAGVFEQVWITFRAALGVPSHFATDPLGAVMYGLMGLGAVTLVAMAAVLGLLVILRPAPGVPRNWVTLAAHAHALALALAGVPPLP